MGTEGGREDPPVAPASLQEEPYLFDFIQAVRLLHGPAPEGSAVGRDAAPGQEVVRFAVHRALGFPASQIHDLAPGADPESPPTMTVAFLGLTGPSGVLPTHYTEAVIEAGGPDGDASPLSDFLDLFHHRLLSFFYRAWERGHPHLSVDPAVRARFQGYLLATIGERSGAPHPAASLARLRNVALWAQRRRSAEGLRLLVEDRLNDPAAPIGEPDHRIAVEVIPFVPRWIEVDPDRRLTLRSASGGGLDGGTFLGARARDWQGRFRLRIGPLTARQFDRLQPPVPGRGEAPGPSPFREIVDLARHYAGPEFELEVVLVLRAVDVRPCRLDRGPAPSRLGRGWMITRPPVDDRECAFRASR